MFITRKPKHADNISDDTYHVSKSVYMMRGRISDDTYQ